MTGNAQPSVCLPSQFGPCEAVVHSAFCCFFYDNIIVIYFSGCMAFSNFNAFFFDLEAKSIKGNVDRRIFDLR